MLDLEDLRTAGLETTHDPDTAATQRGRLALLNHINAHTQAPVTPDQGSVTPLVPRRRRRAPWLLIPAAAAAAVGALVFSQLSGDSGDGATPAAAATLEQAALNTMEVTDPVVTDGQYRRVETTFQNMATASVESGTYNVFLGPTTQIMYVPADPGDPAELWYWDQRTDGHGTEVLNADDLPDDVVQAFEHGDPATDGVVLKAPQGRWYSSPAQFSPEDLADLPRDPHALLDHIHEVKQGESASADEQVFVFITDAMRTGMVDAELRAVFYKTLMLVPDVDVTAASVAIDGRSGVAIGRWESVRNQRQEVIIDPSTGEWIGERTISTQEMDGILAGTVLSSATYATGVVDKVPEDVTQAAVDLPEGYNPG